MVRRIGAPKQEPITEKAEPKAVQEEQVVETIETTPAEAVEVAIEEPDVSTVAEATVDETVVEEAPATATEELVVENSANEETPEVLQTITEDVAPVVTEGQTPKGGKNTITLPDNTVIDLSSLSDVAKFNVFINMCSKYINPEFSRALFDFCCVHIGSTMSKELYDFLHTVNKDTA